jgi:glycosyltransferase involved in cell wall biosynthesis
MSRTGPTVAVVVSSYNRADRLADLLDSLAGQTLSADEFEVVIVDNGSSDQTPRVLERELQRDRLRLQTLRHERTLGPAGGRNTGWRAAKAQLIAFTDDDCVATPEWLESVLRATEENPGAIVQGRTDPKPDELDELGAFSRTLEITSKGPFYQTCNVVYPRELLERLGGFDDQAFSGPSAEDADLAWRAIEAGVETVFAPEARVQHAVNQLGPVGKLQLAARWSEGMQMFARHPGLRRAVVSHGVFWKLTHYYLVRAAPALLPWRRVRPFAFWLAWPYLRHLFLERWRLERSWPWMAPYFVLHDLVELIGCLRASVRYRMLIL